MKHFVGDWYERFFLRVAGCEFIQMNRRSASFECWVYHFELNNPLSASISYSNESMKREIWKLNLKTCKKNLWMQSEQYSQRALNNLCSCVTEPIGWRQYFCLSPSTWVSLWGKCNPYPPPEEYCSALDTRQSFNFAASVVACVTGAKSGGRKAPFFPFSLYPTPFDACYDV